MDQIRVNLLFIISIVFLLFGCQSINSGIPSADPPREAELSNIKDASLNNMFLSEGDDEDYLLIVAGHIYGSHKPTASHPADSFLSNLGYFANLNPSMMILLGDIVPYSTEIDFQNLEDSFLNKQTYPIFNAVGNHDVENRQLYEERYGQTFFSFPYRSSYIIILDTELDNCKITGIQLEILETALEEAVHDAKISQIFIFAHKVLFFDQTLLQRLQNSQSQLPNDRYACALSNNYNQLLTDLFLPTAKNKPVYLLSGDVGAWGGNLTPYRAQYQGSDFHILTTGIGDTPQDAVILINVREDSTEIKYISLTK